MKEPSAQWLENFGKFTEATSNTLMLQNVHNHISITPFYIGTILYHLFSSYVKWGFSAT